MTSLDSAGAAIASARRAVATQRYSSAAFEVELQPLAALRAMVEPWRELAAHAVEPNVFYEPAFALAAAPLLGGDIMAGLVWSVGAPRRLAGFFPVRIDRHRYAMPLPVLVTWTHPYAPLGTPLVHREMAEPAIAAWLDYIARDPGLPELLLMRLLAEEGPFAAALASVLARRECEAKSFDRHQRAMLAPGENRARYFERTMTAKRKAELRRQGRRLRRLGAVTLAEARDGPQLACGFDTFLALEASGWKGRAGTAAGQNDAVRDFMARAVATLAAEGKASMYELLLDGKPIAAGILLKSGHVGWFWKISYDEAFSAYSPGVQLVAGMTESVLADTAIDRVDSCATAAHMMINHLWVERLAMTDCLITARADAAFSFALAARFEGLRRTAIAVVKSLRDQIRR
jgi:CelD/BcsL family acetyltransferase involved in cellulose biosynthesis